MSGVVGGGPTSQPLPTPKPLKTHSIFPPVLLTLLTPHQLLRDSRTCLSAKLIAATTSTQARHQEAEEIAILVLLIPVQVYPALGPKNKHFSPMPLPLRHEDWPPGILVPTVAPEKELVLTHSYPRPKWLQQGAIVRGKPLWDYILSWEPQLP